MEQQIQELILKRIDDVKDSTCRKIDALHADVRAYAKIQAEHATSLAVLKSRSNTHRNVLVAGWAGILSYIGWSSQ